MSVQDRLAALGLVLPAPIAPAAAFVPWVRAGELLFVSGHIARRDGRPWTGQLGAGLTTDEGRQAACAAAVDILATLQSAPGGLDAVRQVVKLMVLVNSTPAFTEQHLVANGASELFQAVFGSLHARSAFGAAQIPLGSCVEVEAVVQVG